MSASEKLKALKAVMPTDAGTMVAGFSVLVAALPQIVAVIEAAELYAEVLEDANLLNITLAALEEALS